MMFNYPNTFMPMHGGFFYSYWWIWPLLIIDLVLKGFALWKSAKNNQQAWFVVLLILNTAGILPAIYLLINKGKK